MNWIGLHQQWETATKKKLRGKKPKEGVSFASREVGTAASSPNLLKEERGNTWLGARLPILVVCLFLYVRCHLWSELPAFIMICKEQKTVDLLRAQLKGRTSGVFFIFHWKMLLVETSFSRSYSFVFPRYLPSVCWSRNAQRGADDLPDLSFSEGQARGCGWRAFSQSISTARAVHLESSWRVLACPAFLQCSSFALAGVCSEGESFLLS